MKFNVGDRVEVTNILLHCHGGAGTIKQIINNKFYIVTLDEYKLRFIDPKYWQATLYVQEIKLLKSLKEEDLL